MHCPDDEALWALLEDQLSPRSRADLEAHLDQCEDCRVLVATLARDEAVNPPGDEGALEPGDKVGRYVLTHRLGRGGMGVVFGAFDPQLDRRIAVKLVAPAGEGKEEGALAAQTALLREARASASLSHDNVVRIYDVGRCSSRVFIAMEYLEGGTLRQWLRAADRNPDQILERFMAAGEGLAAAHRAGLVHRDFKPDNVLLAAERRTCVTDFGLAGSVPSSEHGALEHESPSTWRGGTRGYVAPEVLAAGTFDPRSDQYSFCVALREALTGHLPGERWDDTASSALPRRLRAILERGTSEDPSRRYPSMRDVLEVLGATLHRRARRWALLGVGLVALGGGGLAATLTGDDGCRSSTAQAELWSEDVRARGRTTFEAHGPRGTAEWDDVERWIDAYVERLVEADAQACRIAVQQRVAPRRTPASRCLEARWTDLRLLLERLPTLESAESATLAGRVAQLPSPRSCLRNVGPEASIDPPPRLLFQLARARQRIDRGETDEANALLETLERDPALAADGWLRARASVERARLESTRGDYRAAAEAFDRGAALALAHGDRRLLARAWLDAMWVHGVELQDARTAERLGRWARALVDDDDSELQVRLHAVDARLQYLQGRPDAALASAERAIEALAMVVPAEHPRMLALRSMRGDLWRATGRAAEAVQELSEVRTRLIETVGEADPQTALTTSRLASALLEHGDPSHADTLSADGLRTLRARLGEHPTVAEALAERARILLRGPTPRYDEALDAFDEAGRMLARILGPAHPHVLATELNTVLTMSTRGEAPETIPRGSALLARVEATLGRDHPLWASTMGALAGEWFALDDYQRSAVAYDEVVTAWGRLRGADDPGALNARVQRARARFRLGRDVVDELEATLALVNGRGDLLEAGAAMALAEAIGDDQRTRARDLVVRTTVIAENLGFEHHRAIAEAWLDAHPTVEPLGAGETELSDEAGAQAAD